MGLVLLYQSRSSDKAARHRMLIRESRYNHVRDSMWLKGLEITRRKFVRRFSVI